MAENEGSTAPEPSIPPQQLRTGKLEYKSPALVVYGSVRQLTNAASGTVGDAVGMNMLPSDPALKENVVRVGDHPAGFGLYLFDYKEEFRDACGHGRQFGVMADEIKRIVPEAVGVNSDGFRTVDYALLGVRRSLPLS
jgi:hypothetical protein